MREIDGANYEWKKKEWRLNFKIWHKYLFWIKIRWTCKTTHWMDVCFEWMKWYYEKTIDLSVNTLRKKKDLEIDILRRLEIYSEKIL